MATNFRPTYRTCDEVSSLCPVEATTYGYYPILSVNTFFTVFFGLCLAMQVAFALRTRTWTYSAALGAGTLLEFLGYIGRILMYYNPWNQQAFQLQICCLILGPSFVAAAIYLTLKHLVIHYGSEHSRMKPRLYPYVFVGCDLGSIVLQAIGGGVAAAAGSTNSASMLDAGNNLIVAGIAFQIATMAACGLLVADFLIRWRRSKRTDLASNPSNSEKAGSESDSETKSAFSGMTLFWGSIVFAYTTVLVRCIYRLPEMIGGWGGPLMRKENEFLLLDGMMIGFAIFTLTIIHPGIFFPQMRKQRKVNA